MSSLSALSPARARFRSDRIQNFTESVIREMTRRAVQENALNLAQGFPDFPAPESLKRAAADALAADQNQYSITWALSPSAKPSPPSITAFTTLTSTPNGRSRSVAAPPKA